MPGGPGAMRRHEKGIWTMTRACALGVLGAVALLTGCASTAGLMPTPRIYTGAIARPLFTGPPPPTTSLDLLYVTDRAPVTQPDTPLAYGSDRSRSMAFGSVQVEIGEKVPWTVLAEESTETRRELPLELHLGAATELGRFPAIPYDVDPVPGGVTRSPAVVDVHERAAAGFQAAVSRRIAASPRKEVVLFVHGYANTFQDAASAASSYAGSSPGRPADRAGSWRATTSTANRVSSPCSI